LSPEETTREKMLRGAMELYAVQGVAPTTLSDITRHSGTPRGSVYHYFPEGKSQLTRDGVYRYAADIQAQLATDPETVQCPVMAVITLCRDRLVASDFTSGCPIGAAALDGNDSSVRAAAAAAFDSWEGALTHALVHSGVVRDRACSLSTVLIAMVEGALLMSKAQRHGDAMGRVAHEIGNILQTVGACPRGRRGLLCVSGCMT